MIKEYYEIYNIYYVISISFGPESHGKGFSVGKFKNPERAWKKMPEIVAKKRKEDKIRGKIKKRINLCGVECPRCGAWGLSWTPYEGTFCPECGEKIEMS